MENQYRELSQVEIDLMNEINAMGPKLDALARKVSAAVSQQTVDALNAKDGTTERIDDAQPHRWIAIARTDFQTGLMALVRAVAQPTVF